jgi:integrase
MPNLTKRFIDVLEPPAGKSEVVYWDDKLPCFGVRVRSTGGMTYVIQYRNRQGQTRKLKIGSVRRMTVEEARSEAKVRLAEVERDIDPAERRAADRKAMSIEELCRQYLAASEKGLVMGKSGRAKKSSTLATDRGRIERHIVPLLGSRLVKDLTQADINRFMRDVTAGKTAANVKTGFRGRAIVKGGAGTAARTVGLLGGILSYAISDGIISHNPVRGVKRPADNRRHVRLTFEEYRKLGDALETAERNGESSQTIVMVRLLILTGCRRGEIEQLRWCEIDEAGRCLRLEDTKTGASIRPLGSPVFDILARLNRRDGCDYVIPGSKGNRPFLGFPKAWRRIAERAGLSHVTAHTLRHSFASTANDLGFTEPTIAAMVGHSHGTITGRYIHHLDSALIAATDRVARHIHGCMSTAPVAQVVSLSVPGLEAV